METRSGARSLMCVIWCGRLAMTMGAQTLEVERGVPRCRTGHLGLGVDVDLVVDAGAGEVVPEVDQRHAVSMMPTAGSAACVFSEAVKGQCGSGEEVVWRRPDALELADVRLPVPSGRGR